MEFINEKQLRALKHFAKDPEVSKKLLKGVQFDDLGKQEASDLLAKCRAHEKQDKAVSYASGLFAQNYRKDDGSFATVYLTTEELESLRQSHRGHCMSVLKECVNDFKNNPEHLAVVFEKRCDKVFSWIQQALDDKVRTARANGKGGR